MFLRTLVSLLILGSFVGIAAAAPPNVVLIVSDDQGWGDFGFMGHQTIKTPRLDKLAEQSAVFVNGYVPTSLCRPSLATILTGLYPHQHKICCNNPPKNVAPEVMHEFIRTRPTVPRLLQSVGYLSLQTGKLWDGHFRNAGFTEGMTVKGRHGDDGLAIGRKTMKPIYDFIEAEPPKPFFVWYAPMMPHEAHTAPPEFLKHYLKDGVDRDIAAYQAMCEWFDATCGELLDYLDQKRLSENTIVLFVIDNGWIQAPSTMPSNQTGHHAPKSKLSPYDGGLRTPIMIRWPGHTKPGRYQDLVSSIDLAPTILAACGVPAPAGLPGLNLLDTAAGRGPLKRDAVYGEIHLHTAVDVDRPETSVTHRWVRQGEWKLIVPQAERSRGELYRVAVDPTEEHDLAAEEPQRVERLQSLLNAWWNPATN